MTAAAAAVLTMGLAGCGEDLAAPAHQHSVAVVTLDRATLAMKAGDQTQLVATAKCSDGVVLTAVMEWTSTDPLVATVSSNGLVSAVAFGTATITATTAGKHGDAALTVTPRGTVIGPAGGMVASADGNVVLEIPAGALAAPIDIAIVKAEEGPFAGDPKFVAGTGYQVEPVALQLQLAARLRIRFDPAKVPAGVYPEQLRIRERAQTQWLDQAHLGLQAQFVSATIDRFGLMALLVQPPVGILLGPAGGIATSADGNAVVDVPPGALHGITDIVINKVPDGYFGGDPIFLSGSGYQVVGTVLNPFDEASAAASPPAVHLLQTIHLRIRFDAATLPAGTYPEQLRIREREEIQWRGCYHDGIQPAQMIQADLDRLGVFGLVVEPPAGTLIGPLGGTAISADGKVRLVVPAGALSQITDVVILPTDPSIFAGDPLYIAKTGYRILPAAIQFAIGAQLRINYDPGSVPNGVDLGWLKLRGRDLTQGSWLDLTQLGRGSHFVEATITGAGVFAIVGVYPPAKWIKVIPPSATIEVGQVLQLYAEVHDATGLLIPIPVTWSSDDPGVGRVEKTGMVSAMRVGVATISATADGVTGVSVITVRPKSPGTNNMSWPTVFADGIGLTGHPVSVDPGIRPTSLEGVTIDGMPFFWSGNRPTFGVYHGQRTFNTWRATFVDGTDHDRFEAAVTWGDAITTKEWSASSRIPVEVFLSTEQVGALAGYRMNYLYGDGANVMYGTDGTVGQFMPLVFTVGTTIFVEKIIGGDFPQEIPLFEAGITADVDIRGRVVYSYQLDLSATGEGTYRIWFRLAPEANVFFTAIGNATGVFFPKVMSAGASMVEIHVTP